MIEKALKNLGFSDREVKVYLVVLQRGPLSVRKIAELTKINRGTTYDILKQLIREGVVNYYEKEKRNFVAEDPSKLADIVKSKQNKLGKVALELREVEPELRSLYKGTKGKPRVESYEGKRGIKIVLEDVLTTLEQNKEQEYLIYSALEMRKLLYESFADFTAKRIQKNIKVKVLALGKGGQLCGLDERKWLDHGENLAATYTIIYSGKVAYITKPEESEPVGVIIVDQGIYETQRMIFNHLWKITK